MHGTYSTRIFLWFMFNETAFLLWPKLYIGMRYLYNFLTCYDHYDDVIMGEIASQINSLTIVYSAVYSGADQSKHQSSASLAFVWGIHRGPVNSPHKWTVTRKMFPFDDSYHVAGVRKLTAIRGIKTMKTKRCFLWICFFLIFSNTESGHVLVLDRFVWHMIMSKGLCRPRAVWRKKMYAY